MPVLRGIEITLVNQLEKRPLEEYPHPEGSLGQVLRGPSPNRGTEVSSSAHQHEGYPMASVYVASIPETPFAVKYRVCQVPPEPARYMLFNLSMNSRDMAAWSIDTSVQLEGRAARSFWMPSGQHEGEIGLDERTFVFLPSRDTSVAEDGGLIEVKVFRASERRPRSPELSEFQYRNNYGVFAPRMGLLEVTEHKYYEHILIDPRDAPYATFRFHYRAMQNLRDLHLIPSGVQSEREPIPASSGISTTFGEVDFRGV
ncbi:hypothetical protein QBC47DRAFT_368759 [Echria macrotheca]|uniref:Uncharacterized protein n=1 Tax=Echria macrotheca TaxID=438768 RepID=A0AAJ0BPY1_9PEZI|nr:hypothetical protein QBC47DRAFT_368759 [Echria macrotheca]